jgi:hypothetical protein
MDGWINFVNVSLCALMAGALAWAVLSHRVHDGVVIKVGLVLMSVGFGALAYHLGDGLQARDGAGIERAILSVNMGVLVALVGALARIRKQPDAIYRLSKWVDLR